MTAYLYPELASKAAYRRAIAQGVTVKARENTPSDQDYVQSGRVAFEGPHYPKAHRYYGEATVENGKVTKVE